MNRLNPLFFLAVLMLICPTPSGASTFPDSGDSNLSVYVDRWFSMGVEPPATLGIEDISPPVISEVRVDPQVMEGSGPRPKISAQVKDKSRVGTVYAEVGSCFVPMVDLEGDGIYTGYCSFDLSPGEHGVVIVAVDMEGNAARDENLTLTVLDPLDLNSNKIEDSLEVSGDSELRVIVLHDENASAKMEKLGCVGDEFIILPGSSMVVERNQLEDLANLGEVEGIYRDQKLQILGEVEDGYRPKDDSRMRVGDAAGEGVTVAILDTGADPHHRSLDDMDDDPSTEDPKIVAFKDFVNGRGESYDDHGHGTHCASLIAGTGESGGVAPEARLVVVKVMDQDGACYLSDALNALDWCMENQEVLGIGVISFSVGGAGPDDGTSLLDKACNKMVEEGMVVCVAAGNSGPSWDSIVIPGSAEKVITVGAVDSDGNIFYRSSRGPTADDWIKPDLVAVGVDVASAQAGTLYEENTMSGTSMAAPQAAGAVAVLLGENPHLEPADVKRLLLKSADDLGPSGPDNIYGWGLLNLNRALALAEDPEMIKGPSVDSLDLSSSTAQVGDPVIIEADVQGEVKEVEAHVVGQDREIRIPMHDFDLNGIYTARWETGFWNPGEYNVRVDAQDIFGGEGGASASFFLI